MIKRQAKLPLISQIIAAGCIVVWVASVSACDLEALFCCDSHGSEAVAVAHADQEHSHDTEHAGTNDPHDADAHHSDETDGHSHDSPVPGSKEGPCCSSLKAVAQTTKPVVWGKAAIFDYIPSFGVPLETHAVSPAHWMNPSNLPAACWDRVISPEVCLGPAFRSNAPPAFG